VPLALYVITGLLVAADAVVPVLPAEVVVVGATTRLAGGPASAVAFIAFVALGSFAGQCAVFLATRRLARRWIEGHSRWSRHVGRDSAVGRWGPRALLVAGFLPGGRLAAAASVGASDVRGRRFAAAAAVGSVLGATYLVVLGTTVNRLLGTSVGALGVAALAVGLLGGLTGWLVKAWPSARGARPPICVASPAVDSGIRDISRAARASRRLTPDANPRTTAIPASTGPTTGPYGALDGR
jgi:membrane-associated protein